jgi:CheY-like chemotaxis protein
LAEDFEPNATSVIHRLLDQGHQVDWVLNGRECVAAFRRAPYDLILMNIMMPDVDGIAATREIRRLEQGGEQRIPILALTASLVGDRHEQFREAGANVIQTKPVDFNALLSAMEGVVPKSGSPVITAPDGVVDASP